MPAREATGGAIRALLNLTPKTGRRIRPDSSDEEIALTEIQVGDRLRVARGGRAGGRRGAGRPRRRRRVDGHGRVHAGREDARRQGDRRHGQRHGRGCSSGPRRSARTPCSRASSPWWPTRSGAGRPSSAWPTRCPASSSRRSSRPRLWRSWPGWLRPVTRAVLRPDRGGLGRHHRLPLRARPGDPYQHHGQRREGCLGGGPHPQRRGAGTDGAGAGPGRRQVRHTDRGQAQGRGGDSGSGPVRGRGAAAGGQPRSGQASTRWRPPSWLRPRSAAWPSRSRGTSPR